MTDTRPPVAHDGSTSHSPLINRSLIHTLQGCIDNRSGIDIVKCRGGMDHNELVSHWHTIMSGQRAVFQLNPNHQQPDYCKSLSEFNRILSEWATSEGFMPDDIHIKRCDFAFDCMSDDNAPLFMKLASLVNFAFIAKHEPRPKDKRRFEVADDMKLTGYLSSKSGVPFRVNLYDKRTEQDSLVDVRWRLECRYVEVSRNKHKCNDVKSMLNAICTELNSLKGFYELAQTRLSYYFAENYKALQQGTNTNLSRNQFLFMHSDRLFSRMQIREFYRLLSIDDSEQTLENRANNYADRHDHLFVCESEFAAFIDEMISCIHQYINDDVSTCSETDENDMSWITELYAFSGADSSPLSNVLCN